MDVSIAHAVFSIAEVRLGIPEHIRQKALQYLDAEDWVT